MRGAVALGMAALGCGGNVERSPTPAVDFDHGTVVDPVPSDPIEPPSFDTSYPTGPYGFSKGAIVADFDFLGWLAPQEAAYDLKKLERVSLADFYDPDEIGPSRLLVVLNAVIWCPPCNKMFAQIRDEQLYPSFQAKGVELLGAIYENGKNPPEPATPTDLKNWGMKYEVSFPLVLDNTFKFGPFTESDVYPVLLFIDTRTMTLLRVQPNGSMDELIQNIDELAP